MNSEISIISNNIVPVPAIYNTKSCKFTQKPGIPPAPGRKQEKYQKWTCLFSFPELSCISETIWKEL
jgi:hypothetical protein